MHDLLINILSWSLVFTILILIGMLFLAVRAIKNARQLDATIQQQRAMAEAHEKTNELNRKLLQAVEQSPTSIVITDLLGRIEYVNRYFERKTGYSAAEAIGNNPRILKSGKTDPKVYHDMWVTLRRGEVWCGQVINRRKDGSEYTERATLTPVRGVGGSVTHYVAIKEDITAQAENERRIYRLAYFDRLTGLPNRTFLLAQIERRINPQLTRSEADALLIIDIDRFKRINEARDHTLGDLVLQAFAHQLKKLTSEYGTAVRIASDQFGVIIPAGKNPVGTSRDLAQRLAERLHRLVRQPILHGNGNDNITITLSIGITLFPDHKDTQPSAVLRRAESALYRAKKMGGNQTLSFEDHMLEEERKTFLIESGLRNAIVNNELCLYLQQFTNDHGQPVGCEALIRWQHPEKGLVSPGIFIPIAEESDLIVDIGHWVLTEACRITAREDMVGHPLPISINISPRHFRRNDFIPHFKSVLAKTGADPTHITLEITENLLLEDINGVILKMNELVDMGVHFSIDDFGTGYSSLSYLKRLPISEMKIDRSFVRDAPTDPNDAALVETIISVARHMRLRIVAEGVETEDQARFIRQWPEVLQQGYLYGQPEPAADWLDRWHKFHHIHNGDGTVAIPPTVDDLLNNDD